MPRVQSPEIMQSVGTTRSKASSAGRGRQDNRRKKGKSWTWNGVETWQQRTVCIVSASGRGPSRLLSVCLPSVSTTRASSLTLGPLSAFTHFLLPPRIYMTLVKPTSSLTSSDHCHKSLFRWHSRGPATFQICFVTRFTTRTPTPDKGNLTFHFDFLVYTTHQIHANR